MHLSVEKGFKILNIPIEMEQELKKPRVSVLIWILDPDQDPFGWVVTIFQEPDQLNE